jgi:hypothetical protein
MLKCLKQKGNNLKDARIWSRPVAQSEPRAGGECARVVEVMNRVYICVCELGRGKYG